MTPKGHLEIAEVQLKAASRSRDAGEEISRVGFALEAIGHALAAIAIELGAPHTTTPEEVTGDTTATSLPAG